MKFQSTVSLLTAATCLCCESKIGRDDAVLNDTKIRKASKNVIYSVIAGKIMHEVKHSQFHIDYTHIHEMTHSLT